MPFFAVCYAHVVRFEKASTPEDAVRLAFGVNLDSRSTVERMPKSPRSIGQKALQEFLRPLAKRHFCRTGNVLSGWEKEPGIHNVHWTQCWLCKKPIMTEPARGGIDVCACQECEPKLDTLAPADGDLSTVQIREKLRIKVRA